MGSRKSSASSTKITFKKAAPNTITARKERTAASKKCKKIFVGLFFSFSGDFGPGWENEKMAGWITAHGGIYEREVSEDTTHLVCTIDAYKKRTVQVKNAWALGAKCQIVVPDWLEDCLPSENSKKRRRTEKGYTLSRVLKRGSQNMAAKSYHRDRFEEGVKAAHELVDNRLHHIYQDATGFEYKIVCTRVNDFGRVKTEKYTIYFFESHAKPSTYMAGAKLHHPGRPASFWRTECHPKMFNVAFKDFQKFFKNITGIAWDDRCDGLPHDPKKFKYHAPLLGRPVGLLPMGKNPPSWKDDKDENTEMGEAGDGESDIDGLIYDTDSEVDDESGSEKKRRNSSSSNFSFTLADYHQYIPILPDPGRLAKPFRSGMGMPAYDRHLLDIEKRYTFPSSDSRHCNRSRDTKSLHSKKSTKTSKLWAELEELCRTAISILKRKAKALLRKNRSLAPSVSLDEDIGWRP